MSTAVRRALYGRLASDTTLTNMLGASLTGHGQSIYHDTAPSGANYPLVIMNKQVGTPTYSFAPLTMTGGTAANPTAYETDVWMIKAVDDEPSADVAEAASERISVLLNDGSFSLSGGAVLYCRRESDLEYEEVADGVTYHHAGSLYRIVFQRT